jgi:toxin ParE1/3/4
VLIVKWRESALDDLEEIVTFIGSRDFEAALRVQLLAQDVAERVCAHPYMYRTGRIPGTREAVNHPNYVLVYRVGDEFLEIVNVLHARQQYP